MERRDFRCCLTGVSLLDSEVALTLLEKKGGEWLPAALPLFGRYEGDGMLVDWNEGPNAELVIRFLKGSAERGAILVDFEKMGLEPQPLEDLEMWLGLLACSQMGGFDACLHEGNPLGFALLSAHIVAEVMDADPVEPAGLLLDDLPALVFPTSMGKTMYSSLADLPLKLRCRFGLSLLGQLALHQQMSRIGGTFRPAGEAILESESEPARYLAEALVRCASDPLLLVALEDYGAQFSDDETSA